ncbi:TY5A [Symbiodinium sp. CCMP2456]|nr:TY5A [Symbiodinium sp. CCMP2456]
MAAPRGLKWKQGRAITSWWTLRDQEGAVQAIVVVYVDDFLLCGPREVVVELTDIIQQVWDTSELTVLGPTTAVRFLGMELHRETETMDEITVHQQGFIQELVRTHGIKPNQVSRVPITKELAAILDQEENVTDGIVKDAQQLTGEVLWVAQRSRPDLAYTTSMMASMCTRTPIQAIQTGIKAIGYLLKTIQYGLKVRWSNAGLVMFCDAAYAPQGGRSHGGWVVTFGGVPIVWRSGRQPMITLSTAEAELLSMIDGAIAMKGVEALLLDVGEVVESKEIASDSMATEEASSSTSRGSGIQVDGDLVGMMMVLLMGLGALLIWECFKWMCSEIYNEYTPGAGKRRLKKLRKLQAATTEAIEKELERIRDLGGEQPASRVQRATPEAPASSTSAATLRLRTTTRVDDRESRHVSDPVPDNQVVVWEEMVLKMIKLIDLEVVLPN